MDDELRAAADLALDTDVTAALLDDAVHSRQAETGAAVTVLRREERFEEPDADLGWNTGAGVLDRQLDVVAWLDALAPRDLRADRHVRRFECHDAAVWHRVARVDYQVQDDLENLSGIRLNGPQLVRKTALEHDAVAHQPLQSSASAREHVVQVEDLVLQPLSAAEH